MVQPVSPESEQAQSLPPAISGLPKGWAVGFIPTVGNTSIGADNIKSLINVEGAKGELSTAETAAALALHGIHNITQPTRKGRPI
ncbi:MAG: hypothetical protein AAB462_01245 [Patescibacteria group bacterium]